MARKKQNETEAILRERITELKQKCQDLVDDFKAERKELVEPLVIENEELKAKLSAVQNEVIQRDIFIALLTREFSAHLHNALGIKNNIRNVL